MAEQAGPGTGRRLVQENSAGEEIILPVKGGALQVKARRGANSDEIEVVSCELVDGRVSGDVFAIVMDGDQALDLAVSILKQLGRQQTRVA